MRLWLRWESGYPELHPAKILTICRRQYVSSINLVESKPNLPLGLKNRFQLSEGWVFQYFASYLPDSVVLCSIHSGRKKFLFIFFFSCMALMITGFWAHILQMLKLCVGSKKALAIFQNTQRQRATKGVNFLFVQCPVRVSTEWVQARQLDSRLSHVKYAPAQWWMTM